MIETKKLLIRKGEILLNKVDLTVKDGEIYLLLYHREQCAISLCDILSGYMSVTDGDVLINKEPLKPVGRSPITVIQQLDNADDFEPDLKLKDILNLNCIKGGLNKKRVLELLLTFDLFSDDLDKKVRRCDPVDFKAFYLAMMLAKDDPNIVIHDFLRGEERAFELKFNSLLQQMKNQGKAILYLTSDVFYAYRIADRVSFLKNGHLVPAEPILSKDFGELDAMDVYKKYLS